MKSNPIYLDKYKTIIEVIVSKYSVGYRDDLKQELYFHLFDFFNDSSKSREKIINLDDYVFIMLKNKAQFINKQFSFLKNSVHSLDNINPKTENSYLENMSHDLLKLNDDFDTNTILNHVNFDIHKVILENLTIDEQNLINFYFFNNISQKELALLLNMSQQAVSKKIKKCLNKLKESIEKILSSNENENLYNK